MPRDPVQTACLRCRKKRAKCSGQNPCQRCEEAGEACEYDYSRQGSKGELRAEIERLKNINEDRNKMLRALASGQDLHTCQTVLQGLIGGNGSHENNPKGGSVEGVDYSTGSLRIPKPRRTSHTTKKELAGLPCFDQLLSWKSCCPNFNDNNLLGKTLERSTILSLPPLPLDAYMAHSRTDTWTRTRWTTAHIRHLFDALITWDYMPFSLLCHDLFLQDFHSGSTRFCSSALVHAILAMATRLVNENNDDSGILPSGWFGSKTFFDEAESEVQDGGTFNRLPDIQALGILSLYQIRCGQEVKAQKLAEAFLTKITELCQRKSLAGEEVEEQYAKVRATTYCAAVSFTRILPLTTGYLFNARYREPQGDLSILDQLSSSIVETGQGSKGFRLSLTAGAHNSQPRNLRVISAKIFQLTEWVYKFTTSARSSIQIVSIDIDTFYKTCLDWYESVFALLNADGSRTPFVLFVHMYYHFCLLCAFRPFISIAVEDSNIQPHNICMQAAQSILALAQSYDDLFTLRRVSGLIPYFVCASGLFSLAMEDVGSRMDPVHLRLGDHPSVNKAQLSENESVVNHCGVSTTPPYLKISATVHASLLLAKMSSTHPAAIMAEKRLKRA